MLKHTQPDSTPRRRRFSYASVAATLALVLSLSGTAYALVVTSADIKDGTIRSVDIKNGQVNTADIRNESITGADVKNGSLQAADLAPSARLDPRISVFSEVVPWTENVFAVTLASGPFTFRADCYKDSLTGVEEAAVSLDSSNPGANLVGNGVRTDRNTTKPFGRFKYGSGFPLVLVFGGDLLGYGVGQAWLTGITPQQSDGSFQAVLVDVTVAANSAGCTFNGMMTDTSS